MASHDTTSGLSLDRAVALRSKAQDTINELRAYMGVLSDSDRFSIFRALTEGYCPECGKALEQYALCSDCE